MKLQELINQLRVKHTNGDTNVEVSGVSIHSQTLNPGDIFVCIPGVSGLQEDRHLFIDKAVEAGAAAVIVERDVKVSVPTVKVSDARYALAVLANHLYGYPSTELKLIGITGTNGKTTTSYMLESILTEAGYRTGLMGNTGTKIGSEWFETDINTQEPNRLQYNLRKMRDQSVDFCFMEVSSQGLHMGRVLGCDFRTAVLTNVSQDHLDYHGTMEEYIAAKGLLFSRMGNSFSADPLKKKYAILNADDESSHYFRGVTPAQVVTYGIESKADVMAEDIQLTSKGTKFTVKTSIGTEILEINLVGKFNVYNALAAISSAIVEGISLENIKRGLLSLKSVAGRMEIVHAGQDFLVLVDYAHTPDGLENALTTLREFADQHIITVFGCGGDRDKTKRPIMGKLAAEYSDIVIVTSDNPRSEDPDQILLDIEQGVLDSDVFTGQYELITDRKQAIERAITLVRPGDIILIAGKGHETYQILKDHTIHFDDREEAKEAILRIKSNH
ncbi:UDP-N-acetylmuramoyl-L-alanyl-D-glutamate--2,6-diaminopimelate ligase [Paenibacillus sp. An7]|uniref:UDP-N-acetylmuramoyl-L-alanyl-D-glutamate--2, 6-diaminopimelate ligase n=1 Tax=Paenibacillus sp. An7 TaxID=2689577 RepID=UPI00135926BE|nr:UDP-N-acetylmuramoyl-L-alanyl-D-glutamate--2,6-diaminopimelate ligase [Paenibacillus sp. An7]